MFDARILRAVMLAILDFARIVSALVVVVGVTSHLGSGAALSPRRCRIASAGARNRTEMLRLRGVLLTILRLLGLSEASQSLGEKNLLRKMVGGGGEGGNEERRRKLLPCPRLALARRDAAR